jgi:serine/threonine protein kinase
MLEPHLAIVTEFCANGSLDDRLYGKRRMEFSAAQLYDICLGTAQGVAHLHADDIVHRDLAARNVLLDKLLVPKVADFGMIRENADVEQGTKTTVGPVRWMAPEQLSQRLYSKASDVYALGCVFYECYAKCVPFPQDDNIAVITKKLSGAAAEPTAAFPQVVSKIMTDTFAANAAERPTANDVCEALERSRALVLGSDAPALVTQMYADLGNVDSSSMASSGVGVYNDFLNEGSSVDGSVGGASSRYDDFLVRNKEEKQKKKKKGKQRQYDDAPELPPQSPANGYEDFSPTQLGYVQPGYSSIPGTSTQSSAGNAPSAYANNIVELASSYGNLEPTAN